jgi:hypothetical protein
MCCVACLGSIGRQLRCDRCLAECIGSHESALGASGGVASMGAIVLEVVLAKRQEKLPWQRQRRNYGRQR